MIHTYKDLQVWKKAVALTLEIYKITGMFPKQEIFGLTSQMRRSAVSIPSNIAEGKLRGGSKECRQFFLIAFGSGGELETQIEISKQLPIMKNLNYNKVSSLLDEVMKMLNVLINKTLEPKKF